MARKPIDIGAIGNDGTGDSIRDSFRKVNDNFRELYSSLGLGDRLTFKGLDDTPEDYDGQDNAIVSVNSALNDGEGGLVFRQLVPGSGIQINVDNNEIEISSQFSAISADPAPQLGGNLSATSGGNQYRIQDLTTPISNDEAANKQYVDTKISRAGVDAVDPSSQSTNPAFGTMTGPLILSRDPEADDDDRYGGLIAATKRYVDSSAFGSAVNLYVATSGEDIRLDSTDETQGRALAYAFRTLEAALKKAEEIVLESRLEIGPYKKILTYNSGAGTCTLNDVSESPSSGSGFVGTVLMSVDTAVINAVGTNYQPGNILTVVGGTFAEPARYEVLSITETGGVATIRQLSSGVYTALPGTTNIATISDSEFGGLGGGAAVARLNFTFKVNNVSVSTGGANYGLVSVRIVGGGGSGAFGTAEVIGGSVQSIRITDTGSGFTSLPNVIVNLPRFLVKTEGFRTDFTGDVTVNTPLAIRSRDIREGLFLRGETSGALAQILAHDGSLDSNGDEIFDVDIQFGNFIEDEVLSYGDITRLSQISILVESGIYEENLPLRIPQNVSIVGDEFRRVIIRPKNGISSSPWAQIKFRRDLSVDGLTTATQNFGYHYLSDASSPVYPLVNNKGSYSAAAQLLLLNRQFVQKEITAWIAVQKLSSISPFTSGFTYNSVSFEKTLGSIIDSVVFDLKYGGSSRTISVGLKYLDETTIDPLITTAVIERIVALSQLIIKNAVITEIYQNNFLQIVDGAFIAETGTGGASLNITAASKTNPVLITTSSNHNLISSERIVISNVIGMTELNGDDFFVDIISPNSFGLYNDAGLLDGVEGLAFQTYVSGGIVTNQGGVIGALYQSFIDVITESALINYPKNNNNLDVFLCNDAVRLQAVSAQGQGGFMMVLDPEGQILAKSPYAQECASFSKSTGVQTFAGGMFIDGFTGNLKFTLLGKSTIPVSQMLFNRSYTIKTIGTTDFTLIGAASNTVGQVFVSTGVGTGSGTVDDNSFLLVGNLDRLPQLPASFIVTDEVYRINYVRDFAFNTAGSTASLVLDENTPWPFELFTYNEVICRRDVGLILDGLSFDIVFGSNYNYRKAGLLYRRASAIVVIEQQLEITVAAVNLAHELAGQAVVASAAAQLTVSDSQAQIEDIIRNGAIFANPLEIPSPAGLDVDNESAKVLLLANIEFLKNQAFEFIDAQIGDVVFPFASGFGYDNDLYSQNIERLLEAVAYDITYGGNSQSRDEALRYFDGVGDAIELQLDPNELDQYIVMLTHLSTATKQVVQNLDPSPLYEGVPRVSGTATSLAIANQIESLIQISIGLLTIDSSAVVAEILPDFDDFVYDPILKTASAALLSEKTNIQDAVIDFIDEQANRYEILMPGNRSMLGNDYTQINDMGYGIVTTNGGLCEAVGVFTYYCFISFYSINGGQIRSVASSSAQGVFALVAEGADPLEVPTPVTTYFDFAQGATCHFPSSTFSNAAGGLTIFVTDYTYEPLSNGELEIDHGTGSLFRYPITAVSSADTPAGVARLTLNSSEGIGVDGLAAVVSDGTRLTIRQNSTIVLTGDVVDVVTRPSTGLIFAESDTVYRILQLSSYVDSTGDKTVDISIGSTTVLVRNNHGLRPDYQISFLTTGSLPTGINTTTIFFVLADGLSANSFRISTTRRGIPVATSGVQTGIQSYIVRNLAQTNLRENYDYIELTVWPEQPYASGSATCTITIADPAVVTLASHGFNNNDVVRFETTGILPSGLTTSRMYFVELLNANTFRVKDDIIGLALGTSGTQSGIQSVGLVIGAVGDTTFAVVPVGSADKERILQTKIVWIGEDYTITSYQDESVTLEPYALLTLNTGLIDSVVFYNSPPELKSAVPKDERGTLTIRISLTRVTGHDLLEIGTGSYSDTNYPSEIYGPAVNALNPANEAVERSVGRVFYVTTDQFGNFNVGPLFRVDQGTGTVTFSAAIALSNLDGIGFKRGVSVSEFSIDSAFTDNATDTVPTENATRQYIDRRLGISHTGAVIASGSLIPITTGGFLPLTGSVSMKGSLNLSNNFVINLADPINPQDAVNLRSLNLDNIADITITNAKSADILTFTGVGKFAQNSTVVGDVSFDIDSTANTVDIQINPGVITNNEVDSSADIVQSKLVLTAASTRADAVAITQADRGSVSFDSAQFNATDGWITVKDNGLLAAKIEKIATKTVLGNTNPTLDNVAAVAFSTVVSDGGAVKKSQYGTTGYLRRIGATFTGDGDYAVVDEASINTFNTLVKRNSLGNFAATEADLTKLRIETKLAVQATALGTGGYLQYFGFSNQIGLQIGDGSAPGDKKTFYDNDNHQFRTQNGLSNAPVTIGDLTAGSVISSNITTGAAATAGTLTGAWTLQTTSGITFSTGTLNMGTGTINVTNGSLQSRTLTTGGTATTGTITGTWSLAAGSRLQATYSADLAEYYEGDREYAVGTVLIFGGDREVTMSSTKSDHRVAGVVSDNAGYVMNGACPGLKNLVALQGRVPCRAVGKIYKGDLMITSGIAGVAVSAKGVAQAGTIIGKALENYDSDHIGTIEVAVGRT